MRWYRYLFFGFLCLTRPYAEDDSRAASIAGFALVILHTLNIIAGVDVASKLLGYQLLPYTWASRFWIPISFSVLLYFWYFVFKVKRILIEFQSSSESRARAVALAYGALTALTLVVGLVAF